MDGVYLGQASYLIIPIVVQKRGLLVTPYKLSEDLFYMLMQIFRESSDVIPIIVVTTEKLDLKK